MVTPGSRLIAFRRSSVDLGSVAAVLATVLAVSALVSGVVASLPALQQESLRAAVRTLPVEETVVEVSSSYVAEDATAADEAVRSLLRPVVATTLGAVVRRAETVGHGQAGADGSWSFQAVTGDDAVTAVTGRLPQRSTGARVEVAVRSGAPGTPAVGERLRLVSPLDGSRIEALVVGSWRPSAEARRAVGAPAGASLLVADGVFEELAGRGSRVVWRAAPAVERLRPGHLDGLRAEVAETDRAVAELAERLGVSMRVENPLSAVLEARSRELTTQRTLLLAPALVLLLLGAAGAMLVATALSEARTTGEGLLRSRGANLRQVVAPTVLEAAVVCVVAAVLGPLLATATVRIGGVRPALDVNAWTAALVAAAVCFVALVVPAVVRAVGGDRGEQLSVERRRRRRLTAVLAGVLLMLALGVVAALRLQGFPDSLAAGVAGVEVDPLVVAAPAMLLLALVTVLGIVLLPLLFRATERAVRTRGVALVVGTRSATRAPWKSVPLTLAVALAAGGITLGTVERASQEGARTARAAYEVGADVRVTAPPRSLRLGTRTERGEIAGLSGVTDVSAVHRELDFVDDVAAEVLVAELDGTVGRSALAASDVPELDLERLRGDTETPSDAVPAAVTRDLAQDAALVTGDRIELTVGGSRAQLEVAVVLPALPTVTGGRAGVLVDKASLLGHTGAASGTGAPQEWWLDVEDARVGAVAASLRERPGLAEDVLTRDQALERLAADPGTGGAALTDVMTVAALGSLLIGGVFLGSVIVLRRREREQEAGVLRALGTAERDVTGTLAAQYGVTTGAGLVAGAVAGLVTAAVALRATALGSGGVPLVPAPDLHVPWGWTLVLLGLLLVVPLVALEVLARLGGGRPGAAADARWRR